MSDVEIVIKARNEAQAAINAVKGDLTQLGNTATSASQQFASAGASMRSAGMGLTAGVTLPIAAIGGAALMSAADFEQAMNVMQQVSGATAGDMAQLQTQALELGAATSFSAGEAAEGMLELAKAGLDAQQVGAAIEGTMDLAAAGNLGLAEAAETAANAVNTFGLDAGDTVKVADMLAAAANASSVEVTDLAQGMKMAGAVFASSGQSIDDLTTAMALMGNAGIKGSDAGTSLKTMLMRLTAPTDDAADALAGLGVDMYDANGAMRDLPAVMADLQQALFSTNAVTVTNSNLTGEQAKRMEYLQTTIAKTQTKLADYQSGVTGAGQSEKERAGAVEKLNATLAAAQAEYGTLAAVGGTTSTVMRQLTEEQRQQALATIFGADAIRAVNVLMAEGKDGWAAMAEAVGAEGAAAEVADARMKGLAGAVEYFKGSVDSFLIGTALPYLDTFGGMIRQAADAISWFGALAPEVKNVALSIAAVAAVAGPALVGIGMLSSTIGAALPVLGAVGGAIAALASPLGLVAAAVGALGVAFATDFAGIRTATMQALNPLIAGAGRVRQAFASGMVTAGGILDELRATLLGLGTDSVTAEISLQELATIFTGSAAAGAQFQAALAGIGSVLTPMRVAVGDVMAAFQAFGASGTWATLTATITRSLSAIGTALSGIFGGSKSLPDLAGTIGAQLGAMAQAVRDAVGSADFGDLRASISGALGLENIDLGQLRDSLAAFVGNIAAEITAFDWGGALTTAGNWLGGLASWVVAQITTIDWGTALATAGEWLGGLTTWVVDEITTIDWGAALTTAGEWLGGLTTWVVDGITGIDWGLALATAGDWLVDFTTWVKDEITTIDWGAALGTAGEWVSNLAKAVAQKIRETDWVAVMIDTSTIVAGGIKSSVTGAIGGINWEAVNTTLFGGLQTATVGAIAGINWDDAMTTAGGINNNFRDAALKELATAINGADVTGIFTALPDAVTAEVKTIKWFDVGKAVADGLQGALSFETLKNNAIITFTALNPVLGGAIAGINWIVSSDQFSGLKTAISGAITGINWGDINTSIQTLWSTARDATAEASKGFHAQLAEWKWPVLPDFKWSDFVKDLKWPTVADFNWSEFVEDLKWPTIAAFSWSDFVDGLTWPSIPSINWGDFIPPFSWPWGGGSGDGSGGGSGSGGSGSGSGGGSGGGGAGQLGMSYTPGGWTWVGEAGPELVHMPRGAEIVPNRQSVALAAALDRVTVTVQQMVVRDDRDIYALAYQVADILARA